MGGAGISAVRTGHVARPTSVGDPVGEPKRERDGIAHSIGIGDRFADTIDVADSITFAHPIDLADGIAIGVGDPVTHASTVTDLTTREQAEPTEFHPRRVRA